MCLKCRRFRVFTGLAHDSGLGPRWLRVRQPGTDQRVVQRHGGQEDAGAVQDEVAAVDPELAEAKSLVKERIQHPAFASSNERLRFSRFPGVCRSQSRSGL